MATGRIPINGTAAIQSTIVDAKGDIIAATGADAVSRLAVGANGTTLVADSSTSTGLKWAAASSGGMTSIASGSLNTAGTTTNITGIAGTYKNLLLLILDWYPVTDDHNISVRINGDTANNHQWTFATNRATSLVNNPGASSIHLNDGANGQKNADNNNFAAVTFYDYANTNTVKTMDVNFCYYSAANAFRIISGGASWINSTPAAITEINLVMLGGSNAAAGTYILYGVS